MENITDQAVTPEIAILVCADTGEYDAAASLSELEELAKTAGANVAATVTQVRDGYDKATCVGSGKLEEITEFAQANGATLLIFDSELSGTQIRNIENKTGIRTIDRTMLILDIFAGRAESREGRLQVELAQLTYLLPRLVGLGKQLSRQGGASGGGGIFSKGPGETKLETDRRHIRSRIGHLKSRLKELSDRRDEGHKRRRKDGLPIISIVGYTNVGKSTLLNRLSESDLLAADMLFATLDPAYRGMTLDDGRNVILTDTVGLIRRLPHKLIEAFKSTLEVIGHSDLILLVCDVGSSELPEQLRVTNEILTELKANDIPTITVYNKCDTGRSSYAKPDDNSVMISALTGEGMDNLKAMIAKKLPPSQKEMKIKLPFKEARLIAKIRQDGKIISETYEEDGISIHAIVPMRLVGKAEAFNDRL